jgi:hypothetical protein
MIESNNYIIKLPLNFDISSTFDMKDLVIYKTQQPILDAPFKPLSHIHIFGIKGTY